MSDPASAPQIASPRVEIAFEYSFQEFKEGVSPLRRQSRRARFWLGVARIVLWTFALCGLLVAIVVGWIIHTAKANILPATSPAGSADLWLALLPSSIAAGTIIFFLFTTRLLGQLLVKLPAQHRWIGVLAGAALGILILNGSEFLISSLSSSSRRAWTGSLFKATMLAFAPWAALAVFLGIRASFVRRSIVWRQWKLTPTFHRHRTMRIDQSGITVDDEISQLLYRWAFYKSAFETQLLIVLSDEAGRRHLLPKRAFADESELVTVRAIIASFISNSRFNLDPRGFPMTPTPVLPLSQPSNA